MRLLLPFEVEEDAEGLCGTPCTCDFVSEADGRKLAYALSAAQGRSGGVAGEMGDRQGELLVKANSGKDVLGSTSSGVGVGLDVEIMSLSSGVDVGLDEGRELPVPNRCRKELLSS